MSVDISGMTSEELYKLYEERLKQEEEESKKVKLTRPPVVLPKNISKNNNLITIAECYMDDVEEGEGVDPEWAFELLMEIVYGKYVFDYINSFDK